jgi:hypothetical protein
MTCGQKTMNRQSHQGGESTKPRPRVLQEIHLVLAQIVLLIPVAALGFQQEDVPRGFLPAMVGIFLVVTAVLYVYISLALQTIANKTNTENAWLAWIPIANLILVLRITNRPLWWVIPLLVPVVNLVPGIPLVIALAKARRKSIWWGILLLVPGVQLIPLGYLAWSD